MSQERAHTVKQGTTRPLTGRLTEDNGRAFIPLSPGAGVTGVTLRARGMGTGATFSGACVVVDDGTPAKLGRWSYSWQAGDQDVVDLYELEFVIARDDGTEDVVPNLGFGSVRIAPALA